VTRVINACEVEARGERDVTPSDIVKWWTTPGFGLDTDARVIADASGSIVAYAEFERTDSPTQVSFDGYVHPLSRGLGLGTWVLDWSEERAAEIAAGAPAGHPSKLQHFLWTQETAGAALLTSRGYEVVRHFYNLAVELDPPPPPPVWPEGIVVRGLQAGDERALYDAEEEAFRDHWGHVDTPFDVFVHYNLAGENFDPGLVFVAVDGEEVVGGSICRIRRSEDAAKGWVADLFVRRRWRRRGIARALLLESFAAYRRRGYERVGLGVDAENLTGAMGLYLGAGMTIENEALCFEKSLRPTGY
jgi:GNAT superfamily N-acetyltransferase